MLSCIGLADSVHEEFSTLLKGKHRAVVFKLDTSSKTKMEIDLDTILAPESSTHEDVASLLPSDECRYVFFNLDYMEGLGKRTKTWFVLWVPSNASTKNRMVYASCAVPLKAKLAITCMSMQTGSAEGFDYEALVEQCRNQFH